MGSGSVSLWGKSIRSQILAAASTAVVAASAAVVVATAAAVRVCISSAVVAAANVHQENENKDPAAAVSTEIKA